MKKGEHVMANLEVAFAGIKMRNPVGIAMLGSPSPIGHVPQRHADFLMRYVEAGAGYVSVPAVILDRKRPKELDEFRGHVRGGWKLQKAATKGFATREGLFACAFFEQIPTYLDEALELMHRLKRQLPNDVPMIVSIEGFGADTGKWSELARILDQEGADLIELNMSCPLPMMGDIAKKHKYSTDIPPELSPEMESLGLSAILGDTPSAIGPIVKAVVDCVNRPVGVKPSPEAGFPRIVAIFK
jgi:dihydroorotate dehydrogenase